MSRVFLPVIALAVALPFAAEAHRAWLLPSATVLSGKEPWVTVDAAVSNDLFYFEHNPLALDGLVITAPDGAALKPENVSAGKYRSTFDLPLKAQGTYRLAVVSVGLIASYEHNGEKKRWRGRAENLAKEVPADAKELKVTQSQRRLETFVTLGKPDEGALKPTGQGLELVPVSHPNSLFAGSETSFRMLLDGKNAPNLKVTMVRGGGRYRTKLGEMSSTTDADGKLTVTFADAGMYWLEATVTDDKPAAKEAKERRVVYAVTLEVLPE